MWYSVVLQRKIQEMDSNQISEKLFPSEMQVFCIRLMKVAPTLSKNISILRLHACKSIR